MSTILIETVAGTPERPGTTLCLVLLTDCLRIGRNVVALAAGEKKGRVAVTDSLSGAMVFASAAEARTYVEGLEPDSRRGWTATIVPY